MLVSERLIVFAIWEKVAVVWMGKDFAVFVSIIMRTGKGRGRRMRGSTDLVVIDGVK